MVPTSLGLSTYFNNQGKIKKPSKPPKLCVYIIKLEPKFNSWKVNLFLPFGPRPPVKDRK